MAGEYGPSTLDRPKGPGSLASEVGRGGPSPEGTISVSSEHGQDGETGGRTVGVPTVNTGQTGSPVGSGAFGRGAPSPFGGHVYPVYGVEQPGGENRGGHDLAPYYLEMLRRREGGSPLPTAG